MQMEDVLKFLEETRDKLTPARAQELAKQVAAGEGRDRVTKVAQELLDWSQKNRERLTSVVQREVKAQLRVVGVATKDDVDALRKRVRDLERGTTKKSSARKPAAKRAAKKPSAAKRAGSSGGSSAS